MDEYCGYTLAVILIVWVVVYILSKATKRFTSPNTIPFNTVKRGDEVVYFVEDQSNGRIKIGYSKNFPSRFNTLKTSSSAGLEILLLERGTQAREAELHKRFKKCRRYGEWFDPAPKLLNYIGGDRNVMLTKEYTELDEFRRRVLIVAKLFLVMKQEEAKDRKVGQMFVRKSENTEGFIEYRSATDPIFTALENDLNQLQEADTQIAGELMYAEKKDNPTQPIGEAHLSEFRRFYDQISASHDQMASLFPPSSLVKFQELYLEAISTLLDSVSYRVQTCEFIISGDGENAEISLLQVQPTTNEFKRKENIALDELEKGLNKIRR